MSQNATVDYESLFLVFGTHRIRGRAKGASLSVVYDEDAFQKSVGLDGEGFWIKNGDHGASITVTLQQSARSNRILSLLHIADRSIPGGLMLPLYLREANGTTLAIAAKARIIKQADQTWSDGGETRAWTIGTVNLRGIVGDIATTPLDPNPNPV